MYSCFFLSGFSGLLNEVIWSRLFVYTMGSSHHSIAVVVSVFMGGLALGSMLGGPLADRSPQPFRLYGWLVLLAGLLSGAVLPLLWLAEPLLGFAYRLHDGEPAHPFFTLVKAVICALTILLPTTLMGATLPALTRHLTRDLREVGARLGSLYAVNTFGAVAGAAAAGFYLIGKIGLGWSIILAAGIDVAVGSVVLLQTRHSSKILPAGKASPKPSRKRSGDQDKEAAAIEPGGPEKIPPAVRIAVVAFGIAGFVNMCLQLGWTRALIISIGNSTYAFSLIVSIFIFGLAAGGWMAGLFADRVKNPILVFGWLLILTAILSGVTIPWLGVSPARFACQLADLSRRGDLNYLNFLLEAAGSVLLVILPPTILMGMALPLAGKFRVLAPTGVGRGVGSAYAANTIGAILGTALTGFVLLPLLGRIWKLLYLAVGLGFLAGIAVVLIAPGQKRLLRYSILGLVVALCLGLAYPTRPHGVLGASEKYHLFWHPVVFSFGSYTYVKRVREFHSYENYAHALIDSFQSLYFRDGEAASVAVIKQRSDNHLSLKISGKTDASAGKLSFDIQTQLLLGHLPLLLHPHPKRALNLGLGGGMTLGAMTLHSSVEEIDLLELCPEVEEAARLYFADANHGALSNPKVRKIIGDGRNHLTHTWKTYDVISSEPSNFWIAGLGNLFTEDFYRIALQRLNPGGIACQWIYGYSIRMRDYKIALRTFLRVFPHVVIWSNDHADTLILGSREPIVFDRDRIARGFSDTTVREELSTIGIEEPEDLFRYFECSGAKIQEWVGEGLTNRDLFPILEFSSPLGFYNPDIGISLALSEAASGPWPEELFRRFSPQQLEMVENRRRQGQNLTRFFSKLYTLDLMGALKEYGIIAEDGDPWSLEYAAHEISLASVMGQRKRDLIQAARKIHDTPELCMADGYRVGPSGDWKTQIEAFQKIARKSSTNRWQPFLALAAIETRHNLTEEAFRDLEAAKEHGAPPHNLARILGILYGMQGDLPRAESLLRESLELTPPDARSDRGESAWNLGYCTEKQEKFDAAIEAYRMARAAGYFEVSCTIATSRCLRKKGDLEAALNELEGVLAAADGESLKQGAQVRAEIARIRAAEGKFDMALVWMKMAAEFDPSHRKELEKLYAQAKASRK